MKYEIEISDFSLDSMKRLIKEAATDGTGLTEETWPHWVGAAKAHLELIVAKAEANKQN